MRFLKGYFSALLIMGVFTHSFSAEMSNSAGNLLVSSRYIEHWNKPLDWIRGFNNKRALGICDGVLKQITVTVFVNQQSENEWRELMVRTECESPFVVIGVETLKAGPVFGVVMEGTLQRVEGVKLIFNTTTWTLKQNLASDYTIILESEAQSVIVYQEARTPTSGDYYYPTLIWAGDINGDQKIDLVLDTSGGSPAGHRHRLLLSTDNEDRPYTEISQEEMGFAV